VVDRAFPHAELDGGRAGRHTAQVERYEHEQLSPAGQIDGWGDLASGLRSHRSGRRRAGRMLAWLALVLLLVTGALLLLH
jgi:hypothetical protein